MPQALHPPHLLSGEVVSVPDERAFEALPRLLQKVWVRYRPAC